MKTNKTKTILPLIFIFFFVLNLFWVDTVSSTGISADAGLTPAANRWIFKSQFRFMKRDNHPTMQQEMKMQMYPIVVAYGLKSNLALMVRQAVMKREMTMMGSNTGFGDLLIMAKYRLARINKPNYTIGIAPTLGMEFPTGADEFTSNSYDLRFGTYFSARARRLGLDLNISYILNNVATTSDNSIEVGNEFSIVGALGYQLSIGSDATFSITPVVESAYIKILAENENGTDISDTGESLFLLAPGFKITWSSYIFESLLQIPVWQDQNGMQTERTTSILVGIRIMN